MSAITPAALAPVAPDVTVPEASGVMVAEEPLHMRLRPGTELHAKVLRQLELRRQAAEEHVRQRYDDWDRGDEALRMYIDLSRGARNADKSEDRRQREMPWGRSLMMPMSYAMYWVRVLEVLSQMTSRDPLIHLQGAGSPEDDLRAPMHEAACRYDIDESGGLMTLFQHAADTERYGSGILYDTWVDEVGWTVKPTPPLVRGILAMLPPDIAEILARPQRVWGLRRSYVRWEPIDPYLALPDPRVGVGRLQDAEFWGHTFDALWAELIGRSIEADPKHGVYFNLEEARKATSERGVEGAGRLSTGALQALSLGEDMPAYGRFHHLQWLLSPADLGLSNETRPEKWWFTWQSQGRGVIVRAHRSEYLHDRFTYSLAQCNPDRHAAWTPGTLEVIDGLQRFGTFVVNSAVQSLMMTMYARYLFDPKYVEIGDLVEGGPGRHVRVTEEGHELIRNGHPVGSVLESLVAQDVSGPNIGMFQQMFQMAQRVTASNDTAQSMPLEDKRTLGEVQATMGASAKRIGWVARLIDAMSISPAAYRMVSNEQQFRRTPVWVRLAGDAAKRLGTTNFRVDPSQLVGDLRYVPHTPTDYPDPARLLETWTQLTNSAGPLGLFQPGPDGRALDPRKIFERAASAAGVRNVDELYVTVVPDEQAANAAQAGNAVPMAGAGAPALPFGAPPEMTRLRGAA